MQAMVLEQPGHPLVLRSLPVPEPGKGQVLIKVLACGVCRTDLHIADGELKADRYPLIPGHEIIGRIVAIGESVEKSKLNKFAGVPWLGYTCGTCKFCKAGKENLCENARFTGFTVDGGYAEYTVADARFSFLLSRPFRNASSAPLLCAGLIGYRCFHMIDAGAKYIGLYGFGAAAHILTQVAVGLGKKIFAFTREGDASSQLFAIRMGACWAGSSLQNPPEKLDAAIILAPVGQLVPQALSVLERGGELVCGGIHMSTIPAFSYDLLWEERSIRSVANLTRQDATDFFKLLKQIPVHLETTLFKLGEANEALSQLRSGKINGAAVLVMP